MELKRYEDGIISYERKLLIVPYGIETVDEMLNHSDPKPFNRTLWN